MLIAARAQARRSERFAISSPGNSFLRSLLATTGLNRSFELHDTREAALLAFGVHD